MTKVYLDTALIRQIQDGRISTTITARIAAATHVTYVFSPAHLDDTTLADETTDERLREGIFSARSALYALPGSLVPRIEIAHLLQNEAVRSRTQIPQIFFNTIEEMVQNYPDRFEVRDVRGHYEPYAKMRTERAFQKKLWAKTTYRRSEDG